MQEIEQEQDIQLTNRGEEVVPDPDAQPTSKPPFGETAEPFKPLFTPVNTDEFLDAEIAKAKQEAQQTPLKESVKPESTASTEGEKASGPDPSSPTFHKATADVIVEFYDFGISYLGMFIAKDEERDEYQIKANDKAKLKSLTSEYLATVKMNRQLPPWLPLAFFAMVVALGVVSKARKRKKEKESRPPSPATITAPAEKQAFEKPIPFSVVSNEDSESKADLALYWKRGNPVPDKERKRRQDAGMPVCDTCQINHVRTKESKRCSKECSGEATKRIRNRKHNG